MSYFDKKEDVLDLKLTPYGRHLLSRGKLKPAFYAFFDDDVVYNTDLQTKASVTDEHNSDLKNRILNETPSLKPHYTMLSVETELPDNTIQNQFGLTSAELITGDASLTAPLYKNVYDTQYRPTSDQNTKFLQSPIGSSKPSVNKGPRWDVQFILGEINTALTTNFTSSIPSENYSSPSPSASVLQIPQLDVEIEWEIEVANQNDPDFDQVAVNNVSNVNINFYEDGSYLKYTEGQVITRILEKNGFLKKDSFEIQVFKYEQDNNGIHTNVFKPLKFMNKRNLDVRRYKIDRDILIENPFSTNLQSDRNTVEYYFDLRVDEEIPIDDLCKGIRELQTENIFIDDLDIRCPDKVNLVGINTQLPDGTPCPPPEQACYDGSDT